MSSNLGKILNNDEYYRSPNKTLVSEVSEPATTTTTPPPNNLINRGSGWGGGCTGMTNQSLSLREHDEQLNTLKKENFNLKLRIYFLEKRIPTFSDDTQILFKQNIDLKVDIEALRIELNEKQNLLCEAATAIKLMEQSLSKLQDENLSTIEEFHEKNDYLEEMLTIENPSDNSINNIHYSTINELYRSNRLPGLEEYFIENEKRDEGLMNELIDNQQLLTERNNVIKDLEKKCELLEYQILEMKEIIAKNFVTQNSGSSMRKSINKLTVRMKSLEMDYKKVKDNKLNNMDNNSKLKELLKSIRNIMNEANQLKITN